MNKISLVFLLIAVCLTGCIKRKPLSPEEEYRMRQQRRMREEQRRLDNTTSLSGLNSYETEVLRRSKSQGDLNPDPGSFVYSPRRQEPHSSDRVLNELNDDGKRNVNEYRNSVRNKKKSGSSWVYGL